MIIWDSTTTHLVIPIINKPRSQRSNLWHLCATGDVHHDTSTPLDLTARVWWFFSKFQHQKGVYCQGFKLLYVYIYNMWKYIRMSVCMHGMHGMFGMHGMHGMFGMHGWYVRTYVRTYGRTYVRMHAWLSVCPSVRLYVCNVWTFQKRCQSWWNLNLKSWCLSLNSVLLGVFSDLKTWNLG